jgi:hypothetical protein
VTSWQKLTRPPWRTIVPACGLLLFLFLAYILWRPGLDLRDGRHDRAHNGIWLGHGWLGGDDWFITNDKTNQFAKFRDPARIRDLASKLRAHHITDVFPHLCPAQPDGNLPSIDSAQADRFLSAFEGFRVIPWVGGPNGSNARIHKREWRAAFATNVHHLLLTYPRFAGVQINVEPLTTGDTNFLALLDEVHAALPPGKILSVAAYPPPTWWHPFPDVHWDEKYFREIARRSDQLAVMTYDAAQRIPRTYQKLIADWTQEVLNWSEGKPVLLGVPTYTDADVGYHDPKVENLTNALLGIHRGLSRRASAANYQGVAIYCEWETSDDEWQQFRDHFLRKSDTAK